MSNTPKRWLPLLPLLTAALLASGACTSGEGPVPSNQPPYTRLFNGVDLSGWTPKFVGEELGHNYLDTFRVEDGVLMVSYDDYTQFDDKFGHLFFETEYSHYVLRLEYRFTGEPCPGGPGWAVRNNGVMFHGQPAETMRLDQNFPCSIEAQLLGGTGTGERATGNACTPGTHIHRDGELVRDHVVEFGGPTLEGNQWVAFELEVHGAERVVHRINGEVVARYEGLVIDPEDEASGGRAEAERRGTTELRGGTLSLQAESQPTEFRNIRLRLLPPYPK